MSTSNAEARFENVSSTQTAVVMLYYVNTGAPTYEYRAVTQLLGSDGLQTSVSIPQITYSFPNGTQIGTNHYWVGSAADYKAYLAGKNASEINSWLMGYAHPATGATYASIGYNGAYSQKKFFLTPVHPKGGEGFLISNDSCMYYMRYKYY